MAHPRAGFSAALVSVLGGIADIDLVVPFPKQMITESDGDQVIGLFYDQDTRAEEFDSETTLGRVVDFVIELHAPGIAEIEARLEEIETAIFAATFSGIECVELGETRFYRDQEGQRFVGIAALTIRFFYAVQRANPSVLS